MPLWPGRALPRTPLGERSHRPPARLGDRLASEGEKRRGRIHGGKEKGRAGTRGKEGTERRRGAPCLSSFLQNLRSTTGDMSLPNAYKAPTDSRHNATITHKVRQTNTPVYMSSLISDYIPSRTSRSSDKLLLSQPATTLSDIFSKGFCFWLTYHLEQTSVILYICYNF